MNPLSACLLALAVFTATAGVATAQQTPSTGPDAYSLVPGLPLRGSLWLRGDDTLGLKWSPGERSPGLSAHPRASLYADWFPFASSSFRVVGGLGFLDGPTSPGNYAYGASLGMRPLVGPRAQSPSTYLGVGYGQPGRGHKGLGFYADMGISMGALASDADSLSNSLSLGADGWRSQGSGWLGLRFQPSVSLGLVYRY